MHAGLTATVVGVADAPISVPRVIGREGVIADLMPDLDAGRPRRSPPPRV